jgi:hypothetical protein
MTPKNARGALKFHHDWEAKCAVQICTRDQVTSVVCVCLICTIFGRDNDSTADCTKTRIPNDKYYTAPWRSDNYDRYLCKQRATIWEDHETLTSKGRKLS